MAKQLNGERITFSKNCTETTGYPHGKHEVVPLHKTQFKVDHQPKCKSSNYKLLEENIGVNFYDFRLHNRFLNILQKQR